MTVEILGAGVAGLCVATALAAQGRTVRVVAPGGTGPGAASWWAGGMLAPGCEGAEAPTEVAGLGARSIGWWATQEVGLVRRGTLVVAAARDAGLLRQFAARTTGWQMLDAGGVAALEPGLAGRFLRGLYFPDEAHLDPRAALRTLAQRLAARGVVFDATATGGGITVDCRGIAAPLPGLRGVRGEMAMVHAPEVSLSRPVRLLHPRHPLYVVPRAEAMFMVGATVIESADAGAARLRSVLELLGAAFALDPGFGEAEVRELGVGIRPAFADNLPRLVREGGVWHLNGLYRHGFLCAPALALDLEAALGRAVAA